jgi:PhnB protein
MIDVQEVYPYLRVHNAAEAIDFYARAFDAKELFRLAEPSGRIGHRNRLPVMIEYLSGFPFLGVGSGLTVGRLTKPH